MPIPKLFRFILTLAIALASTTGFAQNGSQPEALKIRIVMIASAGGTLDGFARLTAAKLRESPLVAQAIVENKPGAGGNIATNYVKSGGSGDHVNILFTTVNHFANPAMMTNAGYDPINDFTPVSYLANTPQVIVVPANSRFKTVKDMLAYAKQQPGALSWGYAVPGSTGHIMGSTITRVGPLQGTPVPFKGGGEVLTSLLGEQIDAAIISVQTALPMISNKRLRALAVSGETPNATLPGVPTIRSEIPTFPQLDGFFLALVKKGTDPKLVDTLHDEFAKIQQSSVFTERLAADGSVVRTFKTRSELESFMKDEGSRWEAQVREAGMKLN